MGGPQKRYGRFESLVPPGNRTTIPRTSSLFLVSIPFTPCFTTKYDLICKRGSYNSGSLIPIIFGVNNQHHTLQNKFYFRIHQSITFANVLWATSMIPTYKDKKSYIVLRFDFHYIWIWTALRADQQTRRLNQSVHQCCQKLQISISLLPLSTDELSIADKLRYATWCHTDMTVTPTALSAFPQPAAPSAH
jgi:hypothetical protein